jgi:glycosyltransferase involved in cell wall biosynthesis
VVVTALDLQHLEIPALFSWRDRLLRRWRWHPSLRRATRVIAISAFTKRLLGNLLGIEEHRIGVVHPACHDTFFDSAPLPRPAIPGDFLLFPASPLPGKNHARLLRAFSRVARTQPSLSLVLSGPMHQDWSPVTSKIAEERLGGRVRVLEHLRLAELRSYYAHARALIFPSLSEGFGLPLVEAMASGCPVAASDGGSIPEVLGDARAILFDPLDERAIEHAIERSISMSESERTEVAASGRRRALQFRVSSMAERTLVEYRKALGADA